MPETPYRHFPFTLGLGFLCLHQRPMMNYIVQQHWDSVTFGSGPDSSLPEERLYHGMSHADREIPTRG